MKNNYYSKEYIKELLEQNKEMRQVLYKNGFLISDKDFECGDNYPFYNNWSKQEFCFKAQKYYFYVNNNEKFYVYSSNENIVFLMGHAYNPYSLTVDENIILQELSLALNESEKTFFEKESELTGVFCLGFINHNGLTCTTDCCGMQVVYHGVIENNLFVSSHSKLIADLLDLKQPKYIQKLTSNRFWHYYGIWLPGDLSPFEEVKRLVPNFFIEYNYESHNKKIERFYPTQKIELTKTPEEDEKIIDELCIVLSNSMKCIANKWEDKKVSLAVTGGRDSMTAMACANGIYDKINYFSYISNYDESVDADAASKILKYLDLENKVFTIPKEDDCYKDINVFKVLMECNSGCIGSNNENDLKKRLFFLHNPPCDIEIKSWVNELGRGLHFNKYNKRKFPKYPYPSYLRAMHKIYITPYLIHNTDKVFKKYLKEYYGKDVFDKMFWVDMMFWEFTWSGGEGLCLTAEQRVCYDITIPFNNRKYCETMLKIPAIKRKDEIIPNNMIKKMNHKISDMGIVIKDISHTNKRAIMQKMYLEIFSKIRF